MKHTLSLTCAALLLAAVPASARPFAPAMSCSAVKGMVASQGAVVISTSATTYDRFVHNGYMCETSTYSVPAFVQTRDTESCFIGYSCTSNPPADFFSHRGGGF